MNRVPLISLNKYDSPLQLSFLPPAIDYSDASMNEARSTLSSISGFIHNAQAYMQGHLQCQDIQESFLWER